jgi:simple sugar transport system ATP-binding protein
MGKAAAAPPPRPRRTTVSDRLIELKDVRKSYGRVFALGGVSLHVDRGEVVGLLGDNGAGKSTLIKILAGVVRPTSGEILVRGKPVYGWSATKSREAGIETVFQDRALAAQQSIVRNIFMGREIAGRFGFLDRAREVAEADRLMREIGFTSRVFSPHSIVGQLSGGERQGVAIARAIYNKADLIILDEPTTALSLTETEKVFRFVRAVRAAGRSILFIGHNIHHVFDIAERFVVLDRGRVSLEVRKAEIGSAEKLVAYMERIAHPQGVGSFDLSAVEAGTDA